MQQQWWYLLAISAFWLALDRAVGNVINTIAGEGVGGAIISARPGFVGVLEICLHAEIYIYLHQDIE